MGSFNRDNRSGGDRGGSRFGRRDFGGKSFGGGDRGGRFGGDRKFGGGGSFGKPQMHDATCSQCGKPCQVPFRPTGDREVFCSNCFKDKKHDAPMRSGGNSFGRPSFDKKPAFGGGNGGNDQIKQQLEALHIKLDKILKALAPAATVSAEKPVQEAKKTKEPLVKAKSAAKKTASKKKK